MIQKPESSISWLCLPCLWGLKNVLQSVAEGKRWMDMPNPLFRSPKENQPLIFKFCSMNETFNRASHTQLCYAVKCERCSVMSNFLQPHALYSAWDSPHHNPGVGTLSLLQGIFPTQWSNLGLLHFWHILNQLTHQESPRIPEWVAYPFSSRSSQPRNQIGISCIAGGFSTSWAVVQRDVQI